MKTNTLDIHKIVTRNEIETIPYYIKIVSFLKEKEIKYMVDVGACTGEYSVVLSENIPSLKKIVLFEPVKSNFLFTKGNVSKLAKDVTVYHGAVFYGRQTVKMAILENVGGATVLSDGYPITENSTAYTLEFLEPGIDFLKLDVEGAERNIIENSLLIKQIPYLDIEFHHYDHELSVLQNRIEYVKKIFTNHDIIYGGNDGLLRENCLFLALKK